MKKHITTAEAAAALGVSVQCVRSLVRRGHLRATRFGAAIVIDAAAVERRRKAKVAGKLPVNGHGHGQRKRPPAAAD